MALLKYPYTNLHELNLDWIIEQLNQSGAVLSVNGQHGAVTLTGEDITRTENNSQTIEQALTSQGSSIQSVQTKIGVTALPTTAQTLTGAIAEHETDITGLNGSINTINGKIGSTALPTTAQTLTGAAAELDGDITGINNKIGSTALPTTAQTLTGAIAEHETNITGLNNAKLNKNTIRASSAVFSATTTGIQTVDITFSEPFNNVPIVLANWQDTTTVLSHMSELVITSISTTGFSIAANRLNASAGWRFDWLAINLLG